MEGVLDWDLIPPDGREWLLDFARGAELVDGLSGPAAVLAAVDAYRARGGCVVLVDESEG